MLTYITSTLIPSQTTSYSTQRKQRVHSSFLILQNMTLDSKCRSPKLQSTCIHSKIMGLTLDTINTHNSQSISNYANTQSHLQLTNLNKHNETLFWNMQTSSTKMHHDTASQLRTNKSLYISSVIYTHSRSFLYHSISQAL